MEFSIEIIPENKIIYFGQEGGSGASYVYHDIDDIANIIKEYIEIYGEI